MVTKPLVLLFMVMAAAAWAGACAGTPAAQPPIVQPGAPGEPGTTVRPADATAGSPAHVQADIEFMQHMLVHHAQAVEMTALVEARTGRREIRLLARRIEASQEDEMASMRAWLEARGAAVPDEHAHHRHAEHAGMPGMIGPDRMARLRAATGPDFDRLFLELMIEHHEGALVMVADLFATDGAGQEVDIFQFASHVDSDQRMEIDRMRALLNQIGSFNRTTS